MTGLLVWDLHKRIFVPEQYVALFTQICRLNYDFLPSSLYTWEIIIFMFFMMIFFLLQGWNGQQQQYQQAEIELHVTL